MYLFCKTLSKLFFLILVVADFTLASDLSSLDTDLDGIRDIDEIRYGTDLNDPGSKRELLGSPTYTMWNGYIQLYNILELYNPGEETTTVTLSIYDKSGSLSTTIPSFTLSAGNQKDIILNSLGQGFKVNSYGLVKIEFDKKLNGRMAFYRSANFSNFDFAFAIPLLAPNFGQTSATFNTFQPSLNPNDLENQILNWLSITNLAEGQKMFEVRFYDKSGKFLEKQNITAASFGRVDLDGGHGRFGPRQYGLIKIIPADSSSPYLSQLARYGSNSPKGVAPESYSFGFPLVTKAGSGRKQNVNIANYNNSENWLEVANTSANEVNLELKIFGSQGNILHQDNLSLSPHSQKHINADRYLESEERGQAQVLPDTANSILLQSMFYLRDSSGSISAMFGSQSNEAYNQQITGSYNLFLEMKNLLSVTNTDSSKTLVNYKISTPSGSKTGSFELNPHETRILNLHQTDLFDTFENTYGIFEINTDQNSQTIVELIRKKDEQFAFPTQAFSTGRTIDFSTNLCALELPIGRQTPNTNLSINAGNHGYDKTKICGFWSEDKKDIFGSELKKEFLFHSDGSYELSFRKELAAHSSCQTPEWQIKESGFYLNSDNEILLSSTNWNKAFQCNVNQSKSNIEESSLIEERTLDIFSTSLSKEIEYLSSSGVNIFEGIVLLEQANPQWSVEENQFYKLQRIEN